MSKNHRWVRVACLCPVILLAAPYARAGLISNGGFEVNGPGPNSFNGWTVVVQPNGQNNWWAQSGTAAPVNAFTVPAPPEGTFAAMTDGPGPSSEALLQSFTVPANAVSVQLLLNYFVLNPASDFINPDTLDFTAGPNQQARIDILTAAAGAFDLDAAVVLNLFATNPGDDNGTTDTSYFTLSQNITGSLTPGSTYQLRFAETDTQGQLLFGVDNVQINITTSDSNPPAPEPGTFLLLAAGVLALGFWKQRVARS